MIQTVECVWEQNPDDGVLTWRERVRTTKVYMLINIHPGLKEKYTPLKSLNQQL